ncbi:30S ribosomal protein S1 [endosymbiont of Euscepes postfasciatus]|uniref:30S ribosomal protein S1 n=1 Tax=endosymbiont of Euscepes postfasciatus TaxID=650377 RepID=UPI000DC70061|nr:30S ribosomal protein S1 [endosymbiont of Euscepes postfasciatus]BBA84546.1 30S ribosomal protein S1 [endosymbiont of Euscepes postfasciatus]
MIKTFSKIFENFSKLKINNYKKILKGTVISIEKNFIIVDSGLKSESYIPIEEFIDENNSLEVNLGDVVEVYLDSIENGYGKTILSRKKAKIFNSWEKLNKIFKEDSIIVGKIIEKVKGGFIILVENIRAFLPGSLVDFKLMNSTNVEGENLELKIIKLDKKNNNIILSRKAIIKFDNAKNKEEFLNNLKVNDIVKGVVKNITDYGAFIDLGFVDGLLHITDITWKRIKHPSEIVNLGDEIDVKIINFDVESSKISLGLKQLSDDPWLKILEKYPKYTKLEGRVTNLTDYGFFVEIEDGIEGLVHISEIDWKYKNINPSKIVKINDIIEIMILDINIDSRRISLGLKQCKDNPWISFNNKYKIGDKIQGNVKSITEFGIFVELSNDIDGLIHITDISWLLDPKKDLSKYSKNTQIESIILQIDLNKFRISLGIKQMYKDPFDIFYHENLKKNMIYGTILENKNFVKINDYILGKIINYSNLNNNFLIYNKKYIFRIIDFDKKHRYINLYLDISDNNFINNLLLEKK